jgi:hypothetical protein
LTIFCNLRIYRQLRVGLLLVVLTVVFRELMSSSTTTLVI